MKDFERIITYKSTIYFFLLTVFVTNVSPCAAQSRNGIDYSDYLKNVRKQIKTNWHPPQASVTQLATVFFVIDKNGNIPSVKICKSSKDTDIDRAALKAVVGSQPFPPPPGNKNISIQYTFDYKVRPSPESKDVLAPRGIMDSFFSNDKNSHKSNSMFIWLFAAIYILLILFRYFAKLKDQNKTKENLIDNSQSLIEKDDSNSSILD